MERAATKLLSLEEYNQLEEQTQIRYEYHGGEVYAMAGGSLGMQLSPVMLSDCWGTN